MKTTVKRADSGFKYPMLVQVLDHRDVVLLVRKATKDEIELSDGNCKHYGYQLTADERRGTIDWGMMDLNDKDIYEILPIGSTVTLKQEGVI
jgi:hypothetical protein